MLASKLSSELVARNRSHWKGLTGRRHCKIPGIDPQDRLCEAVSMSRPPLRRGTGILTGLCALNKPLHGLSKFSTMQKLRRNRRKHAFPCSVWGEEHWCRDTRLTQTRGTNFRPSHKFLRTSVTESGGLNDMGGTIDLLTAVRGYPPMKKKNLQSNN